MTDFATLKSCSELTAEHAKLAASSSVGIRNLLTRVAAIAKPGEGCPKVLMAIARLVGQEWIDGELRVELSGDETATTMIVMCDYGVGIRERLLPNIRFAVPIDEFGRALELSPRLVLPLRQSAARRSEERWRTDRVQERRGNFAMADHRETDFNGTLG